MADPLVTEIRIGDALDNNATPLAAAGGDQPHDNLQPYLTFYCR